MTFRRLKTKNQIKKKTKPKPKTMKNNKSKEKEIKRTKINRTINIAKRIYTDKLIVKHTLLCTYSYIITVKCRIINI